MRTEFTVGTGETVPETIARGPFHDFGFPHRLPDRFLHNRLVHVVATYCAQPLPRK